MCAGYRLSAKSVFLTSGLQVTKHLPEVVGQVGGFIKAVRSATLLGVDASAGKTRSQKGYFARAAKAIRRNKKVNKFKTKNPGQNST